MWWNLSNLFLWNVYGSFTHLSFLSTIERSSSNVSSRSLASEVHVTRLDNTLSTRYDTVHWPPAESLPNAFIIVVLICRNQQNIIYL